MSGHGTGRRSGRVGVRGVLPIGAAGLLAAVTVLMVSTTPQSAGVTGLASERIDLTLPGGTIRLASSFGGGAGTGLADSATGDRAVAGVLADVQDFWSIQLSGNGGSGLTPLAGGVVSMDSTQPGKPALCITDPAQITGNAFYCPQGDGIVYDSSALVPVLLGRYGSAGLAAAFAHEFGHAVQARIGPTLIDREQHPQQYPSILIEAQADCDAGAFLAWASTVAAPRVHLQPASLLRAVAPLLDFRDPPVLSPTAAIAHGLGLDRLSFLLVGVRDGAAACHAMTVTELPLTLGRAGVATGPPSSQSRYPSTAAAVAAAAVSVTAFAGGLGVAVDTTALATVVADPADLAVAADLGQFAAAAAVALVAGRVITGTIAGAACFTGAWTASVFGHAAADELGSWATDADEAMDLIRSRPGTDFTNLAAYADGFHQGWSAC